MLPESTYRKHAERVCRRIEKPGHLSSLPSKDLEAVCLPAKTENSSAGWTGAAAVIGGWRLRRHSVLAKGKRILLERRRLPGCTPRQSNLVESNRMVTGPSFTSWTRIIAWNTPVATSKPSARSNPTYSSYRATANSGAAAPSKLGRNPRRTSPYSVNCGTARTACQGRGPIASSDRPLLRRSGARPSCPPSRLRPWPYPRDQRRAAPAVPARSGPRASRRRSPPPN